MNKVNVNIYGHDYVLVSEKPRDFIIKVANFVNDEILKVSEAVINTSKTDMLILACNNIAEYYHDLLNNPRSINEQELLDKIDAQSREIAYLKLQNEQKDVKIKSLEMTDLNSESLKAKIEKMKSEYDEVLEENDKKIEEYQIINGELESKFFELQLKLAETQEQLKAFQKDTEYESSKDNVQ